MSLFNWDKQGRLNDDHYTIKVEERDSIGPGRYQLSSYNGCTQTVSKYSNIMENSRMHFQKVYSNTKNYVDDETKLFPKQTNPRYINQLYTRPYAGFFCGPGMPSLQHKDLESALFQGLLTNLRQKPCETSRGKTGYNFIPLPEYGNPQRVECIIEPPINQGGWIRSGIPTRDIVRRIDYAKRCKNSTNKKIIYK